MLTNGELACRATEEGILCQVDNFLSVSALCGNAIVLSPQEVYERLCTGRFSWRDVPVLNALSPQQGIPSVCLLVHSLR